MTQGEVHQILVATDFSETAQAAVRVAHAYARAFGARLHVFHVTWPDEHGLTQLFAALVAELGPEVPVEVASNRGDPADEIVRYASGHGIDLIVLGTHGRTGISRFLMGSVAERVIRTAPCPVLSVPPAGGLREDARVPPPSGHRCVVCQTPVRDLVCEPCRARIRGERIRGEREYAGPPVPDVAPTRRPS
jgi:nucleotide-binding universal stress UspA family protein